MIKVWIKKNADFNAHIEIEGIKLEKSHIGKEVLSFPSYVKLEDIAHPEVQKGTISSWREGDVFIKYEAYGIPHVCDPHRIRWVNKDNLIEEAKLDQEFAEKNIAAHKARIKKQK